MNTLVVGAGTGRVAIPISKYTNVDALDFDNERLLRLKQKSENIEIVNKNFLEFNPEYNKYDLIIFPYSTIQFSGEFDLFEKMLKKAYDISKDNTIIIFDASESFNTKPNIDKKMLFKDYCKELSDDIIVYYSSTQHIDNVEFMIEYHLVNRNYSVYEYEKYLHFNKKRIAEFIDMNDMELLKIENGYGKAGFEHKHIYYLRKSRR